MRNVLLEGFAGKTTERVRNNLEENQERRKSAGVSQCAISTFTLFTLGTEKNPGRENECSQRWIAQDLWGLWWDAEFCLFLRTSFKYIFLDSQCGIWNHWLISAHQIWYDQHGRFTNTGNAADESTVYMWVFFFRSPLSSVKPSWLSLRSRSKPWLRSLIFCFRSVCFLCSSGSLVSPSSGEITFLCISVGGNRKKKVGKGELTADMFKKNGGKWALRIYNRN